MSAAIESANDTSVDARAPLDATSRRLQLEMLELVSRTFALTIPRLPPDLADVVGNAYLLCRIVDTVEDETGTDDATRAGLYARFNASLSNERLDTEGNGREFAHDLAGSLQPGAPVGERRLVEHIPEILAITASFTRPERDVLRRCVDVMTQGMHEFQSPGATGRGLDDAQHLDRYCYHVAGCVGELLTDLFCLHDPRIAARRSQLMPLARAFGNGLQLTNILKDMWIDQQRGVCWLPRDAFDARAMSNPQIPVPTEHRVESVSTLMQTALGDDAQAHAVMEAGTRHLIAECRANLDLAMKYVRTLPRNQRGLRIFCLWSIGLSVLTLRKIQRQDIQQRRNGTKVSRTSVKATFLLSGASAGLAPVMQTLYAIACIGLPRRS